MTPLSNHKASPLHTAVAFDDREAVAALLDAGADVDETDSLGETPLTVACSEGRRELAEMRGSFDEMLSRRFDVSRPPRRQDEPTDVAETMARIASIDFAGMMGKVYERPVKHRVAADDPATARLLLDRDADPNLFGSGENPLGCAASAGRVATVLLLLERGADIDGTGARGATALMLAAEEGRAAVVSLLLERGADCFATTSGMAARPPASTASSGTHEQRSLPAGINALHFAAKGGSYEVARLLTERGLEVNCATERGVTPLLNAAIFKRAEMAAYLRESGAQVGFLEAIALGDIAAARAHAVPTMAERAPDWGFPVLQWAVRTGNKPAIRLLVESGIRVDPSDPAGSQIIKMASLRGDADLLASLISAGTATGALAALPGDSLMAAVRGNHLDVARRLVQLGADVNSASDDVMSPLAQAAIHGLYEMAVLLLDAGADPKGSGIHAPLTHAVLRDDRKMVQLLLDRGADRDLKREAMPGAWAIAFNKPEIKALLREHAEKRKVDKPVTMKQTEPATLIEAAKEGDIAIVRRLLDHGAAVDIVDSQKMTGLLWACLKKHVDIARILVDRGADVRHVSEMGNTAIRYAAGAKQYDLIEILVSAGARIGLVEAILLGDDMALLHLLDAGADLNERGPDGTTPLMAAARTGALEVVDLLLSRGADLETADRMGATALGCAAGGNHLSVMRLLLESGADCSGAGPSEFETNIRNKMTATLSAQAISLSRIMQQEGDVPGPTPLHWTSLMGHEAASLLLLDAGADPEAKAGEFLYTPLMQAAAGGHVPVARLLIERGADIHATNVEGETALFVARSFKKNAELTAYLAAISAGRDSARDDPGAAN